ncbi:MAG: pitrilysin family protein [Azospirillaceae bacterium]|nr:pitrilysin family protein [Azospirillaceae bacterium]
MANGLEVVVATNRRMPVVTHMVWYKVGAADEPRFKSGIAHFLEHLMFKGTEAVPPGDFSRIIARNGGQENAFTTYDYTAYYQNVAVDRLPLVMQLEADRMAGLRLTDALVDPERDVVLEERHQRTDNLPAGRLTEALYAALFVHHPYGIPVIGWEQEIRGLMRADAEDFYRTWYAPNNAVLVISGDVDAAQVRPLAETWFGAIPARPVPPRCRPQDPPMAVQHRVVLRDPRVRQASLRQLWQAPSYRHGDSGQAFALQVLAEILGGGATGRLYRSLVVEQRVATSAGFGYAPSALDYAVIGASLSPAPDSDPDQAEAALTREIERVVADGVTDDEVDAAKRRLIRESIFARDSLRGPAFSLGTALAIGRTVADVESWPARIAAVGRDQVNAAARAILGQPGRVTGVLLPETTASRAAAEEPVALRGSEVVP